MDDLSFLFFFLIFLIPSLFPFAADSWSSFPITYLLLAAPSLASLKRTLIWPVRTIYWDGRVFGSLLILQFFTIFVAGFCATLHCQSLSTKRGV